MTPIVGQSVSGRLHRQFPNSDHPQTPVVRTDTDDCGWVVVEVFIVSTFASSGSGLATPSILPVTVSHSQSQQRRFTSHELR